MKSIIPASVLLVTWVSLTTAEESTTVVESSVSYRVSEKLGPEAIALVRDVERGEGFRAGKRRRKLALLLSREPFHQLDQFSGGGCQGRGEGDLVVLFIWEESGASGDADGG